MALHRRLAKLEREQGVGPGADGACGYCRGRENELGKVVVLRDPPNYRAISKWDAIKPNPGPTPCPRCGRDMNVTIIIKYVDMISQRRAEMGLPPLPADWRETKAW